MIESTTFEIRQIPLSRSSLFLYDVDNNILQVGKTWWDKVCQNAKSST